MPPPKREQQALWPRAKTFLRTIKLLVLILDANEEDTFSFYGRSMNNPEWTQGVLQLACVCFHSTKNCSGIVFAGLMPSNHVKCKSASTSYENNLTWFYRLVHSCSNDRRWAIRFAAARIDFLFVLSDRSKANFSADSQNQRVKQQKALAAGPSMLVLTDQEEAWRQWRPSDSRSSKDIVISNPVTVKQKETEPSKAG